jgi:hypothetical protein
VEENGAKAVAKKEDFMTAEAHDKKRFGTIAIQKGFITFEQLLEAIHIQIQEDVEEEKHRLIGKILFDKGHLTVPQIDDILMTLGKSQN